MGSTWKQIAKLWGRLNGAQRGLVGGVGVLVVIGVIIAATWGSTPSWRLLRSDLDSVTFAKAAGRLDEASIPWKQEADRNLLVDARNYDKAQGIMAQNQISATPDDGGGYKSLDGLNLGMTEEQQKMKLRAAQEAEIRRSLKAYDGVLDAKVHLVAGDRWYTRRDSSPAKASVVLTLKPGRTIDALQAETMTRFVANAVQGLSPENVTISDTHGTQLSRAGEGGGAGIAGFQAARAREADLTEKAQSALDLAFGPKKAVVRVNVVLETTRTEESRDAVLPDSKVTLTERISSTAGAAKSGGNSASTAPPAQPGNTERPAGDKGPTTEESSNTFGYTHVTTRMVHEAGAIRRLTVSVALDKSLEEQQAKVKELVKGAVGFNESARLAGETPDFLEVAVMKFADEVAAPATKDEPAASAMSIEWPPIMELIKYGVTGLVVLVLGLMVSRGMRSARASIASAMTETKDSNSIEVRHLDPTEQIKQEVERDAQAVGKLLRSWLYEPANR